MICGAKLRPGWHGDHVVPFSKGGATRLKNGQATCPRCNLRKGNSMTYFSTVPGPILPETYANIANREWQQEGLGTFQKALNAAQTDIIAHAFPGAGKTRFAAAATKMGLDQGDVDAVIVIAPQSGVVHQWRQLFTQLALPVVQANPLALMQAHANAGPLIAAMTYAAMARESTREALEFLSSQRKLMVVFDEVHHLGENASWGAAASEAFSSAKVRLHLSGTPFRSDDQTIPFVMDSDGRVREDISYGFEQAVRDEVCRPIYGHRMVGRLEIELDGSPTTIHIGESASDRESRKVLQAISDLSTFPAYAGAVIKAAAERLNRIRTEEQPDAAMLIVTSSQANARIAADIFAQLEEEYPLVAVSDDPASDVILEQFRSGTQRCLVNVKMASEGYDAARIRVIVFLSNVRTRMNWMQTLGRAIRRQPKSSEHDRQDAHVYFPPVQPLGTYMREIAVPHSEWAASSPFGYTQGLDISGLLDDMDGLLDPDVATRVPRTYTPAQPLDGDIFDVERDGVLFEDDELPEDVCAFIDTLSPYLPESLQAMRPERLGVDYRRDAATKDMIDWLAARAGLSVPIALAEED